MPFFTRSGDDGTTGLLDRGRVPKYEDRLEALGSLDEASAALGVARAAAKNSFSMSRLLEAQRDLYHVMTEVAASPGRADQFRFDPKRVEWIEKQIEELAKDLEMPGEFIVPGDSPAGAAMAMARAVIRRAERRIVELFDKGKIENPGLQQYLNRLSSLLFILELLENQAAGKPTTRAKTP